MPKKLPNIILAPGQSVAVYGQKLRANKYLDHYTIVDGRPYVEPPPIVTPPPPTTSSPVGFGYRVTGGGN